MNIYKYNFNREGRPGVRKLVFVGQHEPEVETGNFQFPVEIEVEGETAAFVIGLTREEAKRVRVLLDKMGY